MAEDARPYLDFSAPETREILRQAHVAAPTVENVILLRADTGEHLPVSEGASDIAQTMGVLGLAQALFADDEPRWIDRDVHLEFPVQRMLLQTQHALTGLLRDDANEHVAVALGDTTNLARARQQLLQVADRAREGRLRGDDSVLLFNSKHARTLGDIGREGASLLRDPDPATALFSELLATPASPERCFHKRQQLPVLKLLALYTELDHTQLLIRSIRFLPNYLLMIEAGGDASLDQLATLSRDCGDNLLRTVIAGILESGIGADTSLAADDQEWQVIVKRLRTLERDDLLAHLSIGGFADHRLGDEGEMEDGAMVLRCQECIYYLPKRRWCDLPELPVPVEAHWYCRLWKL